MLFGPSSNEYTVRAPNQQSNQIIGRLPNLQQGRLGVGTTGGASNLMTPQSMNSAQGNPNVAMMINALMNNKAA